MMGWGTNEQNGGMLADLVEAVDRHLDDPGNETKRLALWRTNERARQMHPDWLRTEL